MAAAEPGLDESADPEDLLAADLPAIEGAVGHLLALSAALDRTADGLRGIETGSWTGEAGDAFRARFDESPGRWRTGADAFADAATACEAFRRTVVRSRELAARAVELFRSGVDAREAAARSSDPRAAGVPGAMSGPALELPDPGAPMIAQAVRMLDDARRERDRAGADAAGVVLAAAGSAPEPPSTPSQLGAEVSDGLAEGRRVLAGIGVGVEDAARFLRTVNPLDPWNLTHPASYVDGLSSTVAGAVSANLHPAEVVKSTVGTGWGSDPATALGRLVPGVALSAATGGAGSAGLVGRGMARAVPAPEPAGPRHAAADLGGGGPEDARPERPPPKTDDSPDLPARAELNPWFANEQYGRSFGLPGQQVRYFDDEDRDEARLTVHDGLLYDRDGERFESEMDGSHWSEGEARSIFVMDSKGNLYVSNDQVVGRMHHSSFLAGQPVAGAGEIGVVDGRVEAISDRSGHYTPPAECLDQVMAHLRREGVDLDGVRPERWSG